MAAEEWEGREDLLDQVTVPEVLAPDLDWAAVEVPEVLEVVRALGLVARAADCGNRAACRAAEAADPVAPGAVPGEPVVLAVVPAVVVEALGVVGEPEPEVGRAAGDLVVVASVGPGPEGEMSAEAREVLEEQAPAAGLAESAVLEVGLVREAEVAGLGEEPAAG